METATWLPMTCNCSEAKADEQVDKRLSRQINKTKRSKLKVASHCTCAQTIVRASHCVGFTFPGIMLLPGSFCSANALIGM